MSKRGMARMAFILSGTDAILALVLAMSGDFTCVAFALLGGVMWVCGSYLNRTGE